MIVFTLLERWLLINGVSFGSSCSFIKGNELRASNLTFYGSRKIYSRFLSLRVTTSLRFSSRLAFVLEIRCHCAVAGSEEQRPGEIHETRSVINGFDLWRSWTTTGNQLFDGSEAFLLPMNYANKLNENMNSLGERAAMKEMHYKTQPLNRDCFLPLKHFPSFALSRNSPLSCELG